MATLNTLLVNADGPTIRLWTAGQDFATIDEGIASADGLAIGSDENVNTTISTTFRLSSVNADFGNMDALSFQVRYRVLGAQTNNRTLRIRIATEANDPGTGVPKPLAGLNSSFGAQVVASNITNTTFQNSAVTAFTFVDTAASKAEWDDAIVHLELTVAKNMGGDTNGIRVDTLQITGTYTEGAPGTTHEGAVVEEVVLTESKVRIVTFEGGVSDSVSLSGPTEKVFVGEGIVNEVVNLDDNTGRNFVTDSSVVESLNLTEADGRISTIEKSAAAILNLLNEVQRAADYPVDVEQAIALADIINAGLDLLSEIDEAITLSSTSEANISLDVIAENIVEFMDAVNALAEYHPSVGELITLSDNVDVTANLNGNNTEGVLVINNMDAIGTYHPSIVNAVNFLISIVGEVQHAVGVIEGEVLNSLSILFSVDGEIILPPSTRNIILLRSTPELVIRGGIGIVSSVLNDGTEVIVRGGSSTIKVVAKLKIL